MALIVLPRALCFVVTATLAALLAAACATGTKVTDEGTGGEASTPDTTGSGTEVCRLHSCDTDGECGGCAEGKTLCLVAEHRCVACDPGASGCAEGEFCAEAGVCVPTGQTCAVDDGGTPTISCGSSLDCAACDSLHQICDTVSSSCVTCTDDDTSACATPACNSHRCAECSSKVACPTGNTCSPAGVCEPDDTTAGSGGAGGGTDGAGGGSPGGCHDICASGEALDTACDPCVTTLCASDDYCCTTTWDEQCVSEVNQYCGQDCSGITGAGGGGPGSGAGGADGSGGGSGVGSGSGSCAHDVCVSGEALNPFCADCALAVCSQDAFCCVLTWDAQCVAEVAQYCSSGC